MKKEDRIIKEGKLSIEQLKELIFKYTENYSPGREEVISRPDIGEDCSIIDPGEKKISISSDPITGAAENLGKLSVLINLNDIASSGGEPLGIMVTILAPLGTTEGDMAALMEDIAKTAGENKVEVLGGHTEITSAVNRTVVSITAIGTVDPSLSKNKDHPRPGYDIYMTKDAGLEGVFIIGNEKRKELENVLDDRDISEIHSYGKQLSVMEDARLARGFHPPIMHDITEGGVLGALWEICELISLGALINYEDIPLSSSAKKIAAHFNIDPLRLISSGSLMFILDKKHRKEVREVFEKSGIRLSLIGTTTEEKKIYMSKEGQKLSVDPPQSDELYKI